jgi:GNAT superfamily N-acetyltransferase
MPSEFPQGANMDDLFFRRAEDHEIDLLIKSRMDYCLRDKADISKEEYQALDESVKNWTIENVKNKSYIGYYCLRGNEIVGFAGMLLFSLPPYLGKCNRKVGHVLSFFTYPQFRSKGIGDKLMKYIIEEAKILGLDRLDLIATPMGEPLYRKNGFKEPRMVYLEKNI